MGKKLLIILVPLLVILTACNNSSQVDLTPVPEVAELLVVETEEETEMEIEAETNYGSESVVVDDFSDDIFSFMFSLNGVVYTLPFPVSELVADGWEGRWHSLEEETLESNRFTARTELSNSGMNMLVRLVNNAEDTIPLNESIVGFINHSRLTLDSGTQVIFPGNITIGSSLDDVIAAHGEPTRISEVGEIKTLTYRLNMNAQVDISINLETGLVTNLSMENFGS